jgi:hypothetical protein
MRTKLSLLLILLCALVRVILWSLTYDAANVSEP